MNIHPSLDISILSFTFSCSIIWNLIIRFWCLNCLISFLYIYISLIGWKNKIKSNKLIEIENLEEIVEEGWRIWCMFCRKVKHRYRFYRRWNYGWPETAIRALHRFSNKFKKVSPEFLNSSWSFPVVRISVLFPWN